MITPAIHPAGNNCPLCYSDMFNNDDIERHYWWHKLENLAKSVNKKGK